LEFRGVNWWPLIRTKLLFWTTLGRVYERADYGEGNQIGIKKWLAELRTARSQYKQANIRTVNSGSFSSKKPDSLVTDVTFFTYSNARTIRFNNQSYIPYLHSLQENWNTLVSTQVLEVMIPGKENLPHFGASFIINERVDCYRSRYYKKKFLNKLGGGSAYNLNASFYKLIKDVQKVGLAIGISIQDLQEEIDMCLIYKDAAASFFVDHPTKALCLDSFYSTDAMGVTLAAKSIGLKTMDIQHGIQGPWHAGYAKWTNIPENGMQLMPDYFWNYTEKDVQNIESSLGNFGIKSILGGNSWLEKYKAGEVPVAEEFESDLKDISESDEKYMLITLQNHVPVLPDYFIDALSQWKEPVKLLIRFHPNFKGEKENLIQRLKEINFDNYEMEKTGQLPLYDLLKIVNVHVTGSSTVAIEAGLFGIPNIIIHENGKNYFEDMIKAGKYHYADTEEDLLNAFGLILNEKSTSSSVSDSENEVDWEKALNEFLT